MNKREEETKVKTDKRGRVQTIRVKEGEFTNEEWGELMKIEKKMRDRVFQKRLDDEPEEMKQMRRAEKQRKEENYKILKRAYRSKKDTHYLVAKACKDEEQYEEVWQLMEEYSIEFSTDTDESLAEEKKQEKEEERKQLLKTISPTHSEEAQKKSAKEEKRRLSRMTEERPEEVKSAEGTTEEDQMQIQTDEEIVGSVENPLEKFLDAISIGDGDVPEGPPMQIPTKPKRQRKSGGGKSPTPEAPQSASSKWEKDDDSASSHKSFKGQPKGKGKGASKKDEEAEKYRKHTIEKYSKIAEIPDATQIEWNTRYKKGGNAERQNPKAPMLHPE